MERPASIRVGRMGLGAGVAPGVETPGIISPRDLERETALRPGRRASVRAGQTGNRSVITVDSIESSHDPDHPLRGAIAPLVIAVAETYGRALGALHLRLAQPLPGVLKIYEGLGFETVWQQGVA